MGGRRGGHQEGTGTPREEDRDIQGRCTGTWRERGTMRGYRDPQRLVTPGQDR